MTLLHLMLLMLLVVRHIPPVLRRIASAPVRHVALGGLAYGSLAAFTTAAYDLSTATLVLQDLGFAWVFDLLMSEFVVKHGRRSGSDPVHARAAVWPFVVILSMRLIQRGGLLVAPDVVFRMDVSLAAALVAVGAGLTSTALLLRDIRALELDSKGPPTGV